MKTNGTFVPANPDGVRNEAAACPARIRGQWAITAVKQRKGTWYTLNHVGTGAYLHGASSYQALEAAADALDALPIAWDTLTTVDAFKALPVEIRQTVPVTILGAITAYDSKANADRRARISSQYEASIRYADGVAYSDAPKAKPVALGAGRVYLATVNGEQWYGDGCFMAIGEAPARWSNAPVNEVNEGNFNQILPRHVDQEPATLATYQTFDREGFAITSCGVRFHHGRLAACLRAGGKGATLHLNTGNPKLSPALVKNADGKTVALIMPCKQP